MTSTDTSPIGASALPMPPGDPSSALEPSGPDWHPRFPASTSIDDCAMPFRQSLQLFVDALKAAGASVSIANTFRPPERAYLMHWCWSIVNAGADPRTVPPMAGVPIRWDHTDDTGAYSQADSVAAAQAMVNAYAIQNLQVAPALQSRHTAGMAVDMAIAWSGTLAIVDGTNQTVGIATAPQSGMNELLWAVGATYGVIKFVGGAADKPHWSDNGH
jgi:hypothetical protein